MREINFIESCNPPKATAQGSNTILRTRSGRQFVGKKSTSKGKSAQDFWYYLLSQHRPDLPLEGPIRLDLILHFPHNKSARKNVKDSIIYHTTQPDADNLSKLILDVGTRLGYWHDDSQICDLNVRKFRSPSPGVAFRASELKELME